MIPPRALGTTIRWASLLPQGYCVPTRPDIHAFVGFGSQDVVIDVPYGAGEHYTARVRDALAQLSLTPRMQWDRFNGPHDPFGPIVFCPKSANAYKDWPVSAWKTLERIFAQSRLDVEYETGGDLWALEAQLRRASLVIGVDTGSTHLADYMGIPVLGLYGYTTPQIHGPIGPHATALYERKGMQHLLVQAVAHQAFDMLRDFDP